MKKLRGWLTRKEEIRRVEAACSRFKAPGWRLYIGGIIVAFRAFRPILDATVEAGLRLGRGERWVSILLIGFRLRRLFLLAVATASAAPFFGAECS